MYTNKIVNTVKVYLNDEIVAETECVLRKKEGIKMSCCKCILRAESVVTKDGVTTITVADDTISSLCTGQIVKLGLFSHLPVTSECNRIEITDGTTTKIVAFRNQYWRPCKLICRSVLVFRNLEDPSLFVIEKVDGRGVL